MQIAWMLIVQKTKKGSQFPAHLGKQPHVLKSWKLIDDESQSVFCMWYRGINKKIILTRMESYNKNMKIPRWKFQYKTRAG